MQARGVGGVWLWYRVCVLWSGLGLFLCRLSCLLLLLDGCLVTAQVVPVVIRRGGNVASYLLRQLIERSVG